MDDNLYNGIKHYLETLEYPPNTTTASKKTITSQSRLYFVKGEQLYRRGPQTRLVVTKDQVNSIIWSEHQHPLAGHYKFKNTLDRIRRRYYWPRMGNDIKQYIQQCDRCQKQGNRMLQEQLHPIPVSEKPFQEISMDIKHVPISRAGHKYVIAAICLFTKFFEAKALKYITATEVSYFLYSRIICQHSTPKYIITDNGKSFVNEIFATVCQQYSITHKLASTYHPETNANIERWNRTFGQILRTLPEEEKRDWHLYLPAIVYASRTTRHKSTKHTPFFLTYGRDPHSPLDRHLEDHDDDDDEDLDEDENQDETEKEIEKEAEKEEKQIKEIIAHFKCHIEQIKQIRAQALEAICKSQETQKRRFEKKILSTKRELKPPFNIGDHVLVYNSSLDSKLSKLWQQWDGPYIIHKVKRRGTYILKTLNGDTLPGPVHGNRMKIYRLPHTECRTMQHHASIFPETQDNANQITSSSSDDNDHSNDETTTDTSDTDGYSTPPGLTRLRPIIEIPTLPSSLQQQIQQQIQQRSR
ncbi:hypothetical protein O0I10_012456 [Lichtheimia ornata]|uniref:Integrase catalytic domain-containing protein n=1 Tax=Lichtheimia ornata TaxID=688661 RepID=A0AAD7XT76_9FUNG|nr:uncharacterized protein O0I10_012456 [Lichtheimia ornata]KAJ8651966.1 hypothetical protein O0I10_012456 [Lichtheimia ornata]